MRILHVSWEYPPVIYGGLGRHVHALAEEEARAGHDVWVLTQQPPGTPIAETINGVHLIRVPPPLPDVPREPGALVEWVEGLDSSMADVAARVVSDTQLDVVHAHDWVVTATAQAARTAGNAPLVSTFHATEAGRHQGWISSDISHHIHALEYQLAHLSQRIITCSTAMRRDVSTLFGVDRDEVDVVPNGIDLDAWTVPEEDTEAARQRWCPSGTLGVFVGRLEWEKGIHTLLDALPLVATTDLHIVIAGTGTYESKLLEKAAPLLAQERVTFTGWLPENELRALQSAADVIVVPSLYEPFGLVALEAGALGIPAVVADTGGLSDIVDHGRSGHLFEAGNPVALAQAIDHALCDRADTAERLARMARRLRANYQWDSVALETVETYRRAIDEARVSRRATHVVAPEPPTTNLLDPLTGSGT